MKILMTLSNPFTHDLRVFQEARTLVEAGHEVTVLAWDRTGKSPVTENRNGIAVKRIRNNWLMSLLWRKPFQLFIFWQKAARWAATQQFEAVHCHDLDTLVIGLKLKRKNRVRLVFDAHEIFVYLIQRDLTRLFTKFYTRLEIQAARFVDQLIVADEAYRSYYEKIGYSKIVSILNTKPLLTRVWQAPDNKRFTLIYIGTLSRPRFLTELIEVVQNLKQVKLIIAGLGPLASKIREQCASINHIEFLGSIPPENVVPMTHRADAVVCMIDPADENNRLASANKQFEAMVAGRPIITTSGTRSGDITREEQAGLIIPYTKKALTEAIITLRDNADLCEQFGKNALQAALKRYNWEIDGQKLKQIYAE